MAWFFFKSGMFYKERIIYEVFINGLKKLIIPAVLFSAIGFFCYYIIERPKTTFFDEMSFFYVFGTFHGNTPIWFLYSLFVVQILYSLLRKCKINNILIVIFSIGLYYADRLIGFRPYPTYNIPLGLLFFALGNHLKDIQYNKNTIIICLVIYSISLLFHILIDFYPGEFTPFLITIPFALAGCILTNNLFKSFPCICVTPLRFIGHHAMEFYCTHIIIIYLIEQFIIHHTIPINKIVFEFIAFGLYLLLFSIIIHYFKMKQLQWLFGNRNR